MSSTPPPVPQRSPKRNAPKRGPLQERSHSDANEISSRLSRSSRDVLEADNVSKTPYLTLSTQVLRPSTIKAKRRGSDVENGFPQTMSPSRFPSMRGGSSMPDVERLPTGKKAPVLQLKRSVTTLRDMYEAHAEKSRPSTATSPALRPTSSSSRLRSASSSGDLRGPFAWEALNKISSDDMALLPSLSEAIETSKKAPSSASFRSRAAQIPAPSSPNFITFGSSSSPPPTQIYRDKADHEEPRTSDLSLSSPNIVRLGSSSSDYDTPDHSFSSPNVIKLGSSSPSDLTTAEMPRKGNHQSGKHRADQTALPLIFPSSPPDVRGQATATHSLGSSPDFVTVVPTPPTKETPYAENRQQESLVGNLESPASSDSSLNYAHATLQSVLESSPAPPIQYPTVRAPGSTSYVGLSVHKRVNRSSGDPEHQWQSRLSAIPSEFDSERSRSKTPSVHDADDISDSQSDFAASENWLSINPEADGSQVRIIPPEADLDHPEASDEISALPRSGFPYQFQHNYRSPAQPQRSYSYLGTSSSSNSGSRLNSIRNSIDNRLNSMRSLSYSQLNSMRSSSQRPGSSNSAMSQIQLPTWARRYYSGIYRDSFAHMYGSAIFPAVTASSRPTSAQPSTVLSGTSKRTSGSYRSFRDHMRGLLRSSNKRPRLEARQSHIEPGIGPLVSNPVRTRPPPAALEGLERQTPQLSPSRHQQTLDALTANQLQSNRSSYHPADPRSHWGGQYPDLSHPALGSPIRPLTSSHFPLRNRASEWSPHLHRTSLSSWRRSVWHAPSVDGSDARWFAFDLRNAQVITFLVGFVCPLSWFLGANLPLPAKSSRFSTEDVEDEKQDHQQQLDQYNHHHEINSNNHNHTADPNCSNPPRPQSYADLESRIRHQVHLQERARWENARWWRGLNRFMCAVGLVVLVVVIVLAVLGTKGNRRHSTGKGT